MTAASDHQQQTSSVGAQLGLPVSRDLPSNIADDVVHAALRFPFELLKQLPIYGAIMATAEQVVVERARRLDALQVRAIRKRGDGAFETSERTVVTVLDQALRSDDTLVSEYLAGVVAAESGRNDRGVTMAALIGALDGLALRIHYLVYRALALLVAEHRDLDIDLRSPVSLHNFGMSIPPQEVAESLELEDAPGSLSGLAAADVVRVEQACYSLAREQLLSSDNSPEFFDISGAHPGSRVPGEFTLSATPLGIELFLWGVGSRDHDPAALRSLAAHQLETDPAIPNLHGARFFGL